MAEGEEIWTILARAPKGMASPIKVPPGIMADDTEVEYVGFQIAGETRADALDAAEGFALRLIEAVNNERREI